MAQDFFEFFVKSINRQLIDFTDDIYTFVDRKSPNDFQCSNIFY